MLEEFASDLWLAEGPTVRFLGVFDYPTRMALVRLPPRAEGSPPGLLAWSPVALGPGLRSAVEALGEVREIVSPNKIHHLFLPDWVEAFPEARLHAPPGLAARRPELRFDAELGDAPDPAWADVLDQVVVRGSFALEEVLFFHRPSRTALVGDLIQRHDPADQRGLRGLRGWLMRLDGLVGPEGSTPREWRASFWRRSALRDAVRRALAWQPERLVVAHGECARDRGADVMARALAWTGA